MGGRNAMSEPTPTLLLQTALRGDARAAEELLPILYSELHRIAQRLMRDQRPDQTLQATALIHEAWLRLIDPDSQGDVESRRHFLRLAARAMRSVLVDHARRRQAEKRGGGAKRIEVEELAGPGAGSDEEVLGVDEVLGKLALEDPELAQLVELRFFGGSSVDETAEILGVSVPTIVRRWRVARSWLARELRP
jgi:RNA polymerase sigma factor (TIGR02999 family)